MIRIHHRHRAEYAILIAFHTEDVRRPLLVSAADPSSVLLIVILIVSHMLGFLHVRRNAVAEDTELDRVQCNGFQTDALERSCEDSRIRKGL